MDYCLHSMVRSPRTRVARAKEPIHTRRQHFILKTQQRLLPGRRVTLNEAAFQDNLSEIRDLVRKGIIEVRTPAGQRIDVNTLASSPLEKQLMPHPRLDSAKDDLHAQRTIRKVDISAEVMANPDKPVELISQEPVPVPVAPRSLENAITPALPVHTPYIPKLEVAGVDMASGKDATTIVQVKDDQVIAAAMVEEGDPAGIANALDAMSDGAYSKEEENDMEDEEQ